MVECLGESPRRGGPRHARGMDDDMDEGRKLWTTTNLGRDGPRRAAETT